MRVLSFAVVLESWFTSTPLDRRKRDGDKGKHDGLDQGGSRGMVMSSGCILKVESAGLADVLYVECV